METMNKQYQPTVEPAKAGRNVNPFFQPKLTINQPNDAYEVEADAMADKVMRMEIPSNGIQLKPLPVSSVQRKCAHCEEEQKMQRKEMNSSETTADAGLESYVGGLNSGGQALSPEARSFYEPRFGYDFSNVKIHDDTVAAKSAQSINALAYTSGNNIVFNSGQYSPNTESGKRLLGHELTHVVQQGKGILTKKIQREVGKHTLCPANTHGAPTDPLTVLKETNDRAIAMSLGASLLLDSDSLFLKDPSLTNTVTLNFYRQRFGDPKADKHSNFKNRFNKSTHKSLLAAQISEMQFLSGRLAGISKNLEKNIHFKCGSTNKIKIGSCASFKCTSTSILGACPGTSHGNSIIVCSGFWGMDLDKRAIGMIHELSHMYYHYKDHDKKPAQTDAHRRTEPECYASLVGDIYGVTPFDVSCPKLSI